MPHPAKTRSFGDHTKESMKEALKQMRRRMSVPKAAKLSGIPFTNLRWYNSKSMAPHDVKTTELVPNYEGNKVLSGMEGISFLLLKPKEIVSLSLSIL